MFDDAYRSGHARVAALVAGLGEADLARTVPACPEWTVHDLVAHLAGTAADVAARHTAGMPGPAWAAAQITRRAGRTVAELLAEWDEHAAATAAAIEDRRVPARVLHDLLVHEGDLVEALGAEQPPWDGWAGAARLVVRQVVRGIRGPHSLVVRSAGTEWRSPDDAGERRGASAAPAAQRSTVTVDFYELYRGLHSRRSRAQMRGWQWDGSPEPWVDALPMFGPRDDEQPVPAPG
ncbi:maleylpyruvate isomerase family mycothiol-dependent enzyme [Actinomycetospora sp. TBRC 11914]|uniref:maleylpyruvate isomerase family mycothiol-dependent enzyme n=1 Tax=Actinomycetospora sp. TBRC 11914 TaxID=2729387 RepID=UPI00145C9626|nr:maleylpyruvate isomerase family mycothiol-dependent enzyme [Actinomycetospora sp. TBRC 11914]NMO92573.1 maleylpyruvate isomerase family mycothiol-dependent enzyme [Actinomycetospora sp. TBRC 11914]